MNSTAQQIRSFWDDRANTFGNSSRATLSDTGMRQLEIQVLLRELRRRSPQRVLDVGCGNGFSTRHAARALPDTTFTGVDYSAAMIDNAETESLTNVRFAVADVLDEQSLPDDMFDVIYTQRCIQNLPQWSQQIEAIQNLLAKLQPGGTLLLMECSRNGVEQLNNMRARFRKQPLDNIEPWHNTFLLDQQVVDTFDASITCFSSTYMFLTKVLHPCTSRIAWRLPAIGQFGYDRLYTING